MWFDVIAVGRVDSRARHRLQGLYQTVGVQGTSNQVGQLQVYGQTHGRSMSTSGARKFATSGAMRPWHTLAKSLVRSLRRSSMRSLMRLRLVPRIDEPPRIACRM